MADFRISVMGSIGGTSADFSKIDLPTSYIIVPKIITHSMTKC